MKYINEINILYSFRVKPFLPTYSELVQYARQKQQEEIVRNVETPNMIAQNTKEQNAVQEMYVVKYVFKLIYIFYRF